MLSFVYLCVTMSDTVNISLTGGNEMERLAYIFVAVVLCVLMASCGGGVSQSLHDDIVAERDTLIQQLYDTVAENERLANVIITAESERDVLTLQLAELQSRVDAVYAAIEAEMQSAAEEMQRAVATEELRTAAASPTYDELFRFPETFRGAPIRITVTIRQADVDRLGGLIQGGYGARMGGQDIAIFDGREVREPRLRVGDNVTIYGVGDGLYRLVTRERGVILGRVVDERYIPRVRIHYVVIG